MKKPGQRKISFIVVWVILLLTARADAQGKVWTSDKKVIVTNLDWNAPKLLTSFMPNTETLIPKVFSTQETGNWVTAHGYIPQDMPGSVYYNEHTGFMCKKEWELEKTAHLPLRFRLGSLEYCNFLEGKNAMR